MKNVWVMTYFGTVMKVFTTLRAAEKYLASEDCPLTNKFSSTKRAYNCPYSNTPIYLVKRKVQR